MRFFLFLFLSLFIESNITERDDVKEFIEFAISNSNLDRDEVLAFIKEARPSKKAVVLKNNQPEVKATWDSYRNTRVSATRIINGLKFLLDHETLLENVEKDFGVSKFYIVSIIGIETNYGRNFGSFNPLDAIFTRAFDPKSNYWQNELLELFKIAKRYNLQPKNMRSSWSGAIGLGQFIPSSYISYGVDYDYNGNVDLMDSKEDGIASIANYLKAHGWVSDAFVVEEVQIENKISSLSEFEIDDLTLPYRINNFRTKITADEIKDGGLNFKENYLGKITPLLVHQNGKTRLFLGFDNFRVITKYNRSSKYALAVHQLAEEIEKKYSEETGLVIKITSLYNGGKYSLYGYKRYNDVRAVLFLESEVGLYGGDPDNFTYPRYNADFAFLRVYDDNGEPLKVDNFFGWSLSGPEENEPIFVIGNPGSTNRLNTVSQLEYARDVSYKNLSFLYKPLIKRATDRPNTVNHYPDMVVAASLYFNEMITSSKCSQLGQAIFILTPDDFQVSLAFVNLRHQP